MPLKSLTGFDANAKTIANVADGAASTDAINKGQLDGAIRGLDWKYEVVAASTANVSLTAPGTSIDGITLATGMQTIPGVGTVTRILLKDQTSASENGVYDWTGSGATLTRSVDSSTGQQISGSTYTVQRGTVNADRVYRVLTDDTITVGTTAITFGQVGAAAAAYTAGNGLQLNSQQFSVLPNPTFSGLVSAPAGLSVDTSVIPRKVSFDCAATTNPQTFTHSLGTLDVDVTVREVSTGALINADVVASSTTAIAVNFGGAPTAAQYRITVMG